MKSWYKEFFSDNAPNQSLIAFLILSKQLKPNGTELSSLLDVRLLQEVAHLSHTVWLSKCPLT